MAHDSTSAAFADEVARVRTGKRHAIAMTPLASVPLDCDKQDGLYSFGLPVVSDKKRRPTVVTKSPGQVMRYPKRPALYNQ